MMYTSLYTTTAASAEQTFVAHVDTWPRGDTSSDYDDMVYNYIEEKHITDLSLLSPEQLAAAHQRALEAPSSPSSETSRPASTEYNTTEEENDLPVSDHRHPRRIIHCTHNDPQSTRRSTRSACRPRKRCSHASPCSGLRRVPKTTKRPTGRLHYRPTTSSASKRARHRPRPHPVQGAQPPPGDTRGDGAIRCVV